MSIKPFTSRKEQSKKLSKNYAISSIDKLILDHGSAPIHKEEIKQRLKGDKNFMIDNAYHRQQKASMKITAANKGDTYIKTDRHGNAYELNLNPSNYKSIIELDQTLSKISPHYTDTKVKRIDFTIDFSFPLESMQHNIDVKCKRISNHSSYMGSNLDFISFGKRTSGEFVKIYDKTKFYQCGNGVTRLEVQLTRPKIKKILPENTLELFKELQNPSFHSSTKNPFKRIELVTFELMDPSKVPKEAKYHYLCGCISTAPFSIIRRRFNHSGNFKRDWKKYYSTTPQVRQPWQFFMEGIGEWFNPINEKRNMI